MDNDFEDEDRRPMRARRIFRPHINDDEDLSPEKFRERFRLSKDVVQRIAHIISPDVQHETQRNGALTPMEQLLLTLRFMATGSFYHVVGDAHGPSKATVCRAVRRVTAALVARLGSVLHFPRSVEACQEEQRAFFEVAGLPAVIGCIDGSHISVKVPAAEEDHYINRHQKASINVMAVAGYDGRLFCVSTHAGGRQHDSRVLATSGLPERMEQGNLIPVDGAIILGDSAYPSRTWLLTPVDQPATEAERRYNAAHAKTRVAVERAFGQLKMRWPCLHGAGLRLKNVAQSAQTIMACCVLHNVAKAAGDDGQWLEDEVRPQDPVAPPVEDGNEPLAREPEAPYAVRRRAFARRAQIVRLFAD